MIRVEGLSVCIDNRAIIQDLSFTVAPGHKAALCGESGSGKTSVLRTLIGILRPNRGRISVDGLEVNLETIDRIRKKLAYVPQQPSFSDDELVRDYILLPFRLRANRGTQPTEMLLEQMLERFRLDRALLGSLVGEVSGGERQRLSLVRALLLQRDVLLLDEVTASLDRENRRIVQEAIFADPEVTVLAVTHDEDWILAASQRVELQAPAGQEGRHG